SLAEDVAGALGLTVWSMVDFEADDALATAAARFRHDPDVEQILLCSPDKDLAQCVSGREVVCLDRRREILLDEEGVVEKFGLPPASIPDYLALVGDAADGIPGLKGWGAKSAAALLSRFHKIEDIPADAGKWGVTVRGADKLAATLSQDREHALLYRRLAVLRTDVPLKEELEDLRWQGACREPLERVSRELGDDRLLGRVPRWRL
ncbi:MAG: flap endonuclease, partial [Acidobacteria bacterium]|nr:flap endonuclease [Acidobacteriota bacterium]